MSGAPNSSDGHPSTEMRRPPMRMRDKLILRVVSKAMIPFILLFALYVQFHGDFGPGGGFQAGVIFAAGLVLYGVIFGLSSLQHLISARAVEIGVALGVLLFGGTGILCMVLGAGQEGVGNFLDYNALGSGAGEGVDAHGQHLGILLVELGVGITVASSMLAIFYMFAGSSRTEDEE
jgi:multicomponent Na+:H+ antiporter subunit B